MTTDTPANSPHWVGLFPAAGFGTRLNGHGSKEIELVTDRDGVTGSRVAVGDLLMRQMQHAGIVDVLLIRRRAKLDLAAHYGDPSLFPELNIIDFGIDPTPSTTHTLDAVFEHWADRYVALGFPDIILQPADVLLQLRRRLESSDSVLCLGLFEVTDTSRYDMVETIGDQVTDIHIKPASTGCTLSWAAAVWQPAFSRYLHQQVATHPLTADELYPGEIFKRAIADQLPVSAVRFDNGMALDVGTPAALELART